MSTVELLSRLSGLGVKLWAEGEELRFRAPRGVFTPDLKEALAGRKREVLEFLRHAQAAAREDVAPIPTVPRGNGTELPLSFAQERLWFLDRWEPASPAYNIADALRLAGGLDPAALALALGEVVRRHEVLRTTFATDQGRPVQVIAPPRTGAFFLPLIDLAGLPPEIRQAELVRVALAESRLPFDLARGPLLRARLARLGAAEHALLWTVHHIAYDGWSSGVLVAELATLYEAFTAGRRSPASPLPLQYADYAAWQRRELAGERLAALLAFWRGQLAGAPTVLELPADRPRPPLQSFRGAAAPFALPAPLSATLRTLAQEAGATPFMVLLAAFQALLGRLCRQDDLLVGSPVAGRTRRELEPLIGFFVNTLALRADLSGDPAWSALLAQARERALAAFAHQEIPFERLVEELQPERDPSRSPLVQVLFVLQNAPAPRLSLPGLAISRLELDEATAKLDLTLTAVDGEEISGTLEYATDLFEAATAERLLRQWATLLSGIAAAPGRRLSDLPLLAEEERRQLLAWSLPARAAPPLDPVARFRGQAGRTPEAVALALGDETLAYGELARRAGAAARRLRGLGVGPGTLVGICAERSLDLAAALLGTLAAGAAYVPLDPSYPAERLALLLEDSRLPVLLTQERLLGRLPVHGAQTVLLDELAGGDAADLAPARPGEGDPDLPAYVIYTSGSTGRPKGAAVRRGAFAELLGWYAEELALAGGDRVLVVSSFSFDLTQKNLFAPLLVGARLHLAPEGPYDPGVLAGVIAAAGITRINCTPSAFYPLAERDDLACLATLRTVVLGGEPISTARLERWRASDLCRAEVLNTYGPTECTDVVACHRLAPPGGPAGPVPAGRSAAAARLLVLERSLAPAPVGVAGEICVAGPPVGLGYLRDAALTAARFLPDPFAGEPGARLYRTGDLGRVRPDGAVEYLGRADQQVKVRGFRIELGEIEAALESHPAVREAAVVVAERDGAGGRLAAWLTAADPAAPPAASALREHLQKGLPEFMVPAAFTVLPELPRSPNGKLDRRALARLAPDAAGGSSREGRPYAPPRRASEEVLAGIWGEALGAGRVGIHDSFFDLGGHSLLATQVLARAGATFGVDLPVRALFEAPTVAGLAARVEQALASGTGRAAPPLVPVPRDRPLPLSYAQERLWFVEQLAPGEPTYTTCRAAHVRGALDLAAAGRTFDELLRRHESLRTVFAAVDGAPAQIVQPFAPQVLPVADLSGLPAAARRETALRLSLDEAQRPFDLARGPLLRMVLLRLGPAEHVLVISLHHISYDLWSGGLLLAEIEQLYLAFAAGRPSPLPELPVQYPDFAVWQRGWLAGEVLEEQLDYWRRQLAGLPALPLDLPTDRPRPAVATHRGDSRYPRLPAGLAEAVKALARGAGVTPFMALLAAFQALLHRLTGQDDVAVGSSIANRDRIEVEGVIGFFDNAIVLRTRLAGDLPFSGLLSAVRDVALGAYAHQHLPFEMLVEKLQPERVMGSTPFYQVVFLYLLNYPAMERELAGLSVVPYSLHSGTAKFDLVFSLREVADGLVGELEYSTELFDAATVVRLLGHYQSLLAAAAADPALPLADLPVLSAPERHQLLAEWNDTARPLPAGAAVHGLALEQAARAPDAVAVTCNGLALSYGELARRSGRLARRLRRLGVGPEARVGVCLDRSTDLVAAVLGVLAAGGAYLPLDPGHPEERLAFILEDAAVPVLIATSARARTLPAGAARVLAVDQEGEEVEEGDLTVDESADPRPVPVLPENLAYVIYTSGSTGRPKGTELTHAGLRNLVAWHLGEHGLTAADRTTLVASPAFDASVWEVWPTLAAGASLHVPPEEVRAAPAGLLAWLAAERVTACFLPTPLAEACLELPLPADLALRALLVGGDRLHPVARALPFRLVNHYGPTESTVVATAGEAAPDGAAPPIGRPLDNLRVHVLDRGLRPVPAGVPGHLHLGGAGLARGYLRRPELTAASFLPNPFARPDGGVGEEPGSRLYRTGDLARLLPDGRVDFLGRVDQQVKIRGFRIEPGEIEAALAEHPGVRAAAVVVREEGGARRLVAFVAPAEGAAPAAGGLREHLRARLPEPMVPAGFVLLAELPLTPNGKVDRRALAGVELAAEGAPAGAGAPRTPRTELEEVVAGVLAEVLGRERVGVAEDFFELGGHSLLATRVVAALREVCGVEVPLRTLFEAPTAAGIAGAVEAALAAGEGVEAPPVLPVERDGGGPLPLSFSQKRLWFLDRLEPGSAAYNVPGALAVEGPLDPAVVAAALAEIVRRHEVLRTTYRAAAGEPVQVVGPAAPFPLPVVDLSALPEAARGELVRRLAAEEAARPFDLERGPLLRVALLRLGEGRSAVLFDMHHIASDGWSIGVFVRELAALYPALAAGERSPLPAPPVQYGDFAVWQRRWLAGEVLAGQLAYWRERLAGVPPVLELPLDRPRSAGGRRRAASLPLTLPAGLAAAVRALGRRERTTLFMTLLAGFQALLHRVSGQDDLCVGTPIAGRRRREVEGLIGFFVNTLALRSEAPGDPPCRDLLARLREATLEAYRHQDLPFEKLVEELQPERNRSHAPLFQAMFALQNAPGGRLELPGLVLTPLDVGSGGAKLDLLLAFEERGEELAGRLDYNTGLFDAPTVARLLGHYESLLAGLTAEPGRRLSELPLLSAAELHQIRREWTPAPSEPAARPCLHELVAAQAVRAPEAVALAFEGEHVTYGELVRRAGLLAAALRALGVGPGAVVGLCAERSIEMVVGMLAALAACGAYAPLDPAYPRAHLALVLEEMRPAAVLAQEAWLDALPVEPERILPLGQPLTSSGGPASPVPLDPEELAYVIYTSGSTGRPKGVMLPHRAIVNHLLSRQARHPLSPGDRFLQQAPFSFEMSVWEIFWPLTAGARLVLARPGGQRDAAYLVRAIAEEGIAALRFTPSMLAVVLEQEGVAACRGLRHIYTGAEPLSLDLDRRCAGLLPATRLHHLYGPTETCVAATLFVGVSRPSWVKLPIGRSLAGAGLHVAGPAFEPVPAGVAGELFLGGPGLSRGYLRRPDLTAERFVPDPWSGRPGARLYRTGDLVRWLPDGNLDFIGRVDHQVKVRGFRVELGEVESALRRHPAVREVAVLARGDAGDRRLVAFLAGEPVDDAELRRFLRERLPEYMVPAAFVALPALPRTRNGKVDRHALAAMEAEGAGFRAVVPPRDGLELALLRVWEEVLGSRRIGVTDSFFDLGGHSLLAVRLLALVERRLGVALPLASLFEESTIERQAARVRAAGTAASVRPLVAMAPGGPGGAVGDGPPFFCVHPIGGNVLCYLDLARELGGDRPFYGLQSVPGEAASVPAMAARYLAEVRRVQPAGPYLLGGWSMGALVAFEMARELERQGEEVGLLALIEPAPVPEPAPAPDEASLLESFGRDLAGLGHGEVVKAARELLAAGRLEELLGGEDSPAADGLAPWRPLYQLYRVNAAALRAYRPGAYGGRIDLFLAGGEGAGTRGWEELAGGGLEVHRLPGDHYGLLRPPCVAELAARLGERMALPEPERRQACGS